MAKKVFIFDDNKIILELCTLILEGLGYEIKVSMSSNEIIDQLTKYKPDLIIMDNWLPDVGGVVATQTLKSHEDFKHIPVIYFSANNDIKSLANDAGADTYLAKPFDIIQLETLVQSLIGEP